MSPALQADSLQLVGWTGWISLQAKGFLRVFSNTTVQKHQFFGAQLFYFLNFFYLFIFFFFQRGERKGEG